MQAEEVLSGVTLVASDFAADRADRQLRRHLDPLDFKRLADAGFLLSGVPADMGGLWLDIAHSTRTVSELLRILARGDASVALVCAMHPAVLSFWLTQTEAPDSYRAAWLEQTRFVADSALNGSWWGTITSEPGSGGDVGRTRAVATHAKDGGYVISGQKHFGSGSGISDSRRLCRKARKRQTGSSWMSGKRSGMAPEA